jgi:hypothetical protein
MIDFKSFLTEEIAEDSTIVQSVVDSAVVSGVNDALYKNLDAPFLTPQAGFQEIRKILFMYGIDMPAVFDLDEDGDELVLDANVYGESKIGLLYILYSLSDEGYYEFYAEVTDEAGIEKLLSDGADEQVE